VTTHSPTPAIETSVPAAVQTDAGPAVTMTRRPAADVAETPNGGDAVVRGPIATMLTREVPETIANVRMKSGAAAYRASPGCEAVIEHVPAATSRIVALPSEVQAEAGMAA